MAGGEQRGRRCHRASGVARLAHRREEDFVGRCVYFTEYTMNTRISIVRYVAETDFREDEEEKGCDLLFYFH